MGFTRKKFTFQAKRLKIPYNFLFGYIRLKRGTYPLGTLRPSSYKMVFINNLLCLFLKQNLNIQCIL